MSVRQTSLDAYEDVKLNLSDRQQIVFDALKKLGEATDREIMQFLDVSDPNKVRPRRNELVDEGVVVEVGKRVCSVGKKNSLVWRLKK